MQEYFRRFRGLRGKSLKGIAYDALQSFWSAFIRRRNWMLEDGSSFPQWLTNLDDLRADHSIGALRKKICGNLE